MERQQIIDLVRELPKPPKALDAMTDLVLAYRSKPKSAPAKKRKRRATKARKENEA